MTAGSTTPAAADHPWSRRRILYDDWTWFLRDPLDVLRLAFIAGTVVFALMGRSTARALEALRSRPGTDG